MESLVAAGPRIVPAAPIEESVVPIELLPRVALVSVEGATLPDAPLIESLCRSLPRVAALFGSLKGGTFPGPVEDGKPGALPYPSAPTLLPLDISEEVSLCKELLPLVISEEEVSLCMLLLPCTALDELSVVPRIEPFIIELSCCMVLSPRVVPGAREVCSAVELLKPSQ
jgi:hypothetical protein